MIPITHADLFSGIGAFKSGLERLNIKHRTLYCSEIDKFAYTSYKAIHGNVSNLGDISKIKVKDIPYTDLITYGFPCQDVSVQGLQKGIIKGETRSGLLYEALRIIKAKKPKWAVAENVKNLVGKNFLSDFNNTLNILENMGYINIWFILNAKDFGLPQNRERVFIISIRKDIYNSFKTPVGKDLGIRLKDILLKDSLVDKKYYLSEEKLKKFIPTKNFSLETNRNKINILGKVRSRNDLGAKVFSPNGICGTLDTMQGGDRQPKILYENKPKLVGKMEIGVYERSKRVYSAKGISATILAKGSPQKILELIKNNKYTIRKLVPQECWRLMGFSDEEFFKAKQALIKEHYNGRDRTNTQLYKQAGNSIAIDCLIAIYKEIFRC